MAERKPAKKSSKGFTAEERKAMRERAQEVKAEAGRGRRKADGESDLLTKVAEMPEPDRRIAERLHTLVKETAPALSPRT